jgi:hypothetical protein
MEEIQGFHKNEAFKEDKLDSEIYLQTIKEVEVIPLFKLCQ